MPKNSMKCKKITKKKKNILDVSENTKQDFKNIIEAGKDNVVAVQSLIRQGMNINDFIGYTKHKISPLYYASDLGQVEIVKLLLANKAQYLPSMILNRTPLHIAAQNGHIEVINELIEHNQKMIAEISPTINDLEKDLKQFQVPILNLKDARNMTAFEMVIRLAKAHIQPGLLKKNSKKNNFNYLKMGIQDRVEIIKSLLLHGAEQDADWLKYNQNKKEENKSEKEKKFNPFEIFKTSGEDCKFDAILNTLLNFKTLICPDFSRHASLNLVHQPFML